MRVKNSLSIILLIIAVLMSGCFSARTLLTNISILADGNLVEQGQIQIGFLMMRKKVN